MPTKRKRSHHRKHRRVGATSLNPKNPLVMLASVAGGFFMGDQVNDALDKIIPKETVAATATTPATTKPFVSGTVTGGIEAGLGGLLLWKGKRSLPMTVAGGVLAGAGLKRILKETGVISGYQRVPVIGSYSRVPVVGKIGKIPNTLNNYTTSRMPTVAGIPNTLNAFTTSRMPTMAGFDDNGCRS